MGNLLGEPFKKYVNDQIRIRQKIHGKKNNRTTQEIQYLSSKNAWVKLASAVMVNEDRIKPILFIREKDQKKLKYDDRMISLSDLQKIYLNILKGNSNQTLSIPKRKFVCFEDHIDFSYSDFFSW